MNFANRLADRNDVDEIMQQALQTGNWQDADVALSDAVVRWPDHEHLVICWALISNYRCFWQDMVERFTLVRERFPDHVFGYSRTAMGLRSLYCYPEAEAILSAGALRFPSNEELLQQWVLVATDMRAWTEAEARAELMVERCPDLPETYETAAEVFRLQGRHTESDVRLAEGLHRLGSIERLMVRFAEHATLREDWPAAVRRWKAVCRHLPDRPSPHLHLATALSRIGRDGDAEPLLDEALARMPDAKDIQIEHAWMATRRNDLPVARQRWESLQVRYPLDSDVTTGVIHVTALANGEVELPAAPPTVSQAPNVAGFTPAELLQSFQSLGEDCEFGLVQRHFRIEPINLFRWAATDLSCLIAALDADFAGVGEPENIAIEVDSRDEYRVKDSRYGFATHTFVHEGQVDAVRFHATQSNRMRFLARRFREDAALGDQIMVRCTGRPTTEAEVRDLHRALQRHGPVVLLHVTRAPTLDRIGTVEWLDEDLMVGFIDRFARDQSETWDISFETWLTLCRTASAMFKQLRQAPALVSASLSGITANITGQTSASDIGNVQIGTIA